jgi:hypothetical protein
VTPEPAAPPSSRGALFAGVMLGTAVLTLAYMDGARPRIGGMPAFLGVALGAVIVWLAVVAASSVAAELLRRNRKAIAKGTVRHGKRGAIATARAAGKGRRSASTRLAAWAGPRWAGRRPADSAWLRPGEKRCRACRGTGSGKDSTGTCPACRGWGSAPPDPAAPVAAPGTACTACGRPASPDDPVLADGGGPVHRSHALEQQASYREALSNPGPGAAGGTAGNRPPPDPAGATSSAVTSPNGDNDMTGTVGNRYNVAPSRINPDRRAHRAASSSGGKVPSEWGPVVATAADFEPESDEHLLGWMGDQTAGMGAYAEALIEAYETGTSAVGIDPKALAALHDVADAAAHCAEMMNGAKGKFSDHYELPREFAANGGLMTHDGRWVTGEGD